MDGDELRAKCKYCNRVLNARYLHLLRHSLSNKHLCNAAAAATISFPIDVDSCLAVEQSEAAEDSELIAGVDYDDADDALADALTGVEQLYAADPTTVSFVADTAGAGIKLDALKKVTFSVYTGKFY